VSVFLTWKRVGSAALCSTQNRTGSCMVSDKTSRRGFHVISHKRPLHTIISTEALGSIPDKGKTFLPQRAQSEAGALPVYLLGPLGLCPGGKATGTPSWPLTCNADVKNWSYTSTCTLPYLNGVVRNQTQELHGNRPIADFTTVHHVLISPCSVQSRR